MKDTEAEVIQDISRRQKLGLLKYGTTVAQNPLSDREWRQHAYEECLDMAIYLKRSIQETEQADRQRVPDEPDWRHPRIQALIGADARNRICIDLVWRILENPRGEFTAGDMEYWDKLHDKVQEVALAAEPEAPAQASIEELEQENRLLRARNERLEKEMAEAVEAEREACAKLVEPSEEHRQNATDYLFSDEGVDLLDGLAAAIRARGAA